MGQGEGKTSLPPSFSNAERGSTLIYIVMDVLEGPTLVDALATRKHLTEDDVKVVLAKLLDAVNYMHLNSGKQNYVFLISWHMLPNDYSCPIVTHRDLKLDNLMLASKDGSDLSSVTIIDFGVRDVVFSYTHAA